MDLPRRSCSARLFSAFTANLLLRPARTAGQRLAWVALLAVLLPGFRLAAQTAQFNGTVRTLGSGFGSPIGVAVDGSGNVFVADVGNGALY